VSFELQRLLHLLTGASGAGKTSLLKMIYLALRPTRLITASARMSPTLPHRGSPLRRRVGVVFQEFRLLDHLRRLRQRRPPAAAAAQAQIVPRRRRRMLAWVGLGETMHAMPATLSGGEKQRLAIAARGGHADVLLGDEPTGNVDHDMAIASSSCSWSLNRLGRRC
jgi:cell division transport system ATP-binding protein